MKLSRLFNSIPKRFAAGVLAAVAIAVPVATSAAATVAITSTTGVANVTRGDTTYGSSTTASYNEVIKVEVTYNNTEEPESGKTANNLRLKLNVPTTAGASQTITSLTSSDNSNTVNGAVHVTLNGKDAYLKYLPGTAEWKHANTANGPLVVQQKISDDVVTNPNGLVLENENPCQAGAVAISVGVYVPGVSVDKYVRKVGDTNWATSINAKAGDSIQYEIAYKNTGNTTQESVEFRDQLPTGVSYVPGTTYLKDGVYPNGTKVNSDAIATNGFIADSYAPGAAGYVMFTAKIADESQLKCGDNLLRNIAFVQPQGMNYYWNTADVHVNKTCTPPPSAPVYSCDLFTLKTDKETRTVTVDKFNYTAKNGATFKNASINWGDNSAKLVTDSPKGKTHTFDYGTYTVTATVNFTTKDGVVSSSNNCSQSVTFTKPGTPTTPPPTVTPPTELPNTGAGDVIGITAVVSVLGAAMYRVFLSRRLAR